MCGTRKGAWLVINYVIIHYVILTHLQSDPSMMLSRSIYSLFTVVVITATIIICNFSFVTNNYRAVSSTRDTLYRGSWRGNTIYDGKDIKRRSNSSSVVNTRGDIDCVNLTEQGGSNGFQPLPPSVVTGVNTLVFFIGIGRSGHSIVASILDSHPHIVISNELNLFEMLNNTSCVTDKSFIFNYIWSKSYAQATTNLRDPSKGYTLAIDGLYQGSYRSHIDVIGDKMGGSTIAFFLLNPVQFEIHLNKLRSLLKVPIKVFQVIRNPFDNIATKALHIAYKFQYSKFATVKKGNMTISINPKIVDKQIAQYFQFYATSQVVKHMFHIDVMQLHNRDLITSPKAMISEMCNFLGAQCSDDFLNVASDKVFDTESQTRYNIKWTDEQILLVKENIKKYEELQRYLDFNCGRECD